MKIPISSKYLAGRGKLSTLIIFTILTIFTACHSNSGNSAKAREASRNRKALYNEEEAAQALEQILADYPWQQLPEVAAMDTIRQLVKRFYEERDFRPAWNTYTVSKHTQAFLNRLEQLDQEGLDSADYKLQSLQHEIEDVFDDSGDFAYDQLSALEVRLSASYLALARQLGKGRIEPTAYADDWHIKPAEVDKLTNLNKALTEGVEEALAEIDPDYRQYELLKEALAHYRAIAKDGGWEVVKLDHRLSPGDSAQSVVAIRQRLGKETELQDTQSPHYDQELQEILQDFRYRYNASTKTSDIDAELVAALNVPVEERIRLISLNMERCRWLSSPMGERYVIVNIPEYRLRVVEKGDPLINMKVIVGKSVHSTPVFSDHIEYLEFAPYWNVPASISKEEILPNAFEDPAYLEKRHYELVQGWEDNAELIAVKDVDWEEISLEDFPYRLRQQPGPWNSLGKVKFMFPNSKAIYLHDTPQDHLFEESEREFSHGCIRVERPDELADYLLPELNAAEVAQHLLLEERKKIPLEEKVPVYLVYFTAVVDGNGALRFLEDIYGLDQTQQNALSKEG